MADRNTGCVNCGCDVIEEHIWNDGWSVCDECLKKIYPLLRKKKTRGLFRLTESEEEYVPFSDVLRTYNRNYIKRVFRYKEENDRLSEEFVPTDIMFDGRFEYNKEKDCFRVKYYGEFEPRKYKELYSPVIFFEEVTAFYIQEHFHDVYNGKGFYDEYDNTDICIETDNPCVDFVELQLPVIGVEILQSTRSAYRKKADEICNKLSDIFQRVPTDRRKVYPYL